MEGGNHSLSGRSTELHDDLIFTLRYESRIGSEMGLMNLLLHETVMREKGRGQGGLMASYICYGMVQPISLSGALPWGGLGTPEC